MAAATDAKLTPTAEQQAVLDNLSEGNGVIEALAGTGKTSVLKMVAKQLPRKKCFYIAYNRAIADDAKKSFPRNTTARTLHSIAFGSVGVEYKHRLNSPRQRGQDVAAILGIKEAFEIGAGRWLRPWQMAMMALETVRRFCYSADETIKPHHVPFLPAANMQTAVETGNKWNELSTLIAIYANRAWQDITKKEDFKLSWGKSHDYYLKMWALTNPVIQTDLLMLDEAQDSNALTAKLVDDQECQKILIGDRYQQLYAWRGAQDAMQNFDYDWHTVLSQSFRFGDAIATEGNKWLTLLGNDIPLRGFDAIESEVRELPNAKTILCRTNAGVIGEAIRVQQEGNTIAIVGGTGEIMSFARAVQALQTGQAVTHPDLMGFSNWDEVKQYVEQGEGDDLRVLVSMVDRFGVGGIIQVADQAVSEEYADSIVSTAHKAKGREWRSVKLSGDFKEPVDPDTGERKPNLAEFQLLYVSVTRARNTLDCTSVSWIDDWLPEPEEKPEPKSNGRALKVAQRKLRERNESVA